MLLGECQFTVGEKLRLEEWSIDWPNWCSVQVSDSLPLQRKTKISRRDFDQYWMAWLLRGA